MNKAAQALGRIKTAKKAAASRENGKLGGRPKKQQISIHQIGVAVGEGYTLSARQRPRHDHRHVTRQRTFTSRAK